MSDRNLFNQVVYTPLSDALRLLEERRKDPVLLAKIEELLKGDIPECFKDSNLYSVHFRQIATPNKENEYFIALSRDHGLQPVFFEYYDDKFTSNNEFKHSLGQLRIHNDVVDKNGNYIEEKITIVDFNKYNGDKLKNVKTIWNESLIDFHKKLFNLPDMDTGKVIFFDGSDWLKVHGAKASVYYLNFFLLFVCHGILFENFLTKGTEGEFSKNIVLPALENVFNLVGLKPLIVPIPPMDTEEEEHWVSYHPKIKPFLNSNNI